MSVNDPIHVAESIYSHIFIFEKSYSYLDTQEWLSNNFFYCYCCCIIYLLVIFSGKLYMLNRRRFNLRGPLALWCGLHAVFSIIGLSRTAPDLFFILRHNGFYHSICLPSNYLQNYVSGFWTWLFVLSKIPEFGDTIFIVLRKQPLLFLHFYRHVTVALYTWLSYVETAATMRWYTTMDYFVHSCLYSMYFLKAMKFRISRYLGMIITVIQIVQMMIGCIISIMAQYFQENYGLECYTTYENSVLSFFLYFTYLILFIRFFYQNYVFEECRRRSEKFN